MHGLLGGMDGKGNGRFSIAIDEFYCSAARRLTSD